MTDGGRGSFEVLHRQWLEALRLHHECQELVKTWDGERWDVANAILEINELALSHIAEYIDSDLEMDAEEWDADLTDLISSYHRIIDVWQ